MSEQNMRVLAIAHDAAEARQIEELLAGARPAISITGVVTRSDSEFDPASANGFGVILIDHTLTAALSRLHDVAPDAHPIIINGDDDEAAALVMQNSAFDYLDASHMDRHNLVRAIQHAFEHRAFSETARQLHELQLIHTMSKAINGNLDLRLKLGIVLEQVINLLNIDAADILLLDARDKTLHYAVGRGFNAPPLLFNSSTLTQTYAAHVESANQLIVLNDLINGSAASTATQSLITAEGFTTYLGMPLSIKGQLFGVLGMFKRSYFEPDPVWRGFIDTFARQAAGAIATSLFENSLKYKLDAGPYYEGGIEDWARAIDRATKEIPGHSKRIADFSMQLGRAIGMSEEDLLHMYQGALLHDIGKMGIPDDVLLKPGPLTAEEWSLMRRHPLYAYHMLASIDYLQAALEIPYLHHEHWDGTGYPLGLVGEEIPLAARVFAVADVWDALRSDRPFRKAWTQKQSFEQISQESGTYLDPSIVAAFQRLISATAH